MGAFSRLTGSTTVPEEDGLTDRSEGIITLSLSSLTGPEKDTEEQRGGGVAVSWVFDSRPKGRGFDTCL